MVSKPVVGVTSIWAEMTNIWTEVTEVTSIWAEVAEVTNKYPWILGITTLHARFQERIVEKWVGWLAKDPIYIYMRDG